MKNIFSTKRIFDRFPEIETNSLWLKEIKSHHAGYIFDHFSAEAVHRFLNLDPMRSVKDAERLIALLVSRFRQEKGIRWGITRKGGGRIIGTVGYNTWSKRKFQAELGYDLSEAYWRQGITTESVEAVIRFGFTRMHLLKIEALILPENVASETFIQRQGFQWEAMVREFQIPKGHYAPMMVYTLERHQWLTRTWSIAQDT
jgi:ribosomal-protein-alanine N-acetyltransferase